MDNSELGSHLVNELIEAVKDSPNMTNSPRSSQLLDQILQAIANNQKSTSQIFDRINRGVVSQTELSQIELLSSSLIDDTAEAIGMIVRLQDMVPDSPNIMQLETVLVTQDQQANKVPGALATISSLLTEHGLAKQEYEVIKTEKNRESKKQSGLASSLVMAAGLGLYNALKNPATTTTKRRSVKFTSGTKTGRTRGR